MGYNLTTGAQYNTLSDDGRVVPLSNDERIAQLRTAVSFGLGYSSPGSFFADFAIRFQYLPNEYITPYWYYYRDNNGRVVALSSDERFNQLRSAVSCGIGYSSPGSFFMDAAVRFLYFPNEYLTPYWYYYRENGNTYTDYSVVTPEICGQSALCNALLTLGWRF